MKRRNYFKFILIALTALSFGYWTTAAEASPITYQFSSTAAWGTVVDALGNPTEFNNASFLISIAGDTNNVIIDSAGPIISNLIGNISLFGGDLASSLSGTFTDALYVYVDPIQEGVAFGDIPPNPLDSPFDLLALYIPGVGLDTYDLKSSFGPITAGVDFPGTGLVFDQFSTNFGTINFTGENIDNATFQAVPEPGIMLLLCSGLAGIVGFRRKFWN